MGESDWVAVLKDALFQAAILPTCENISVLWRYPCFVQDRQPRECGKKLHRSRRHADGDIYPKPMITESKATEQPPQTITISLKEMSDRYLGALQRTHDIASIVVQGTREVNERGYDELTAAARFLPAQDQRRPFATAKPAAERWLLRNLISDAFGAVVPFLEDVRTVCALHEWKTKGSDSATLQPVFNEQRNDFLRKDLANKLAYLKETHALEPQLSVHLLGLEALAACLVRHDGTVQKDAPLAFTLVTLNLVAAPTGSANPVQPQMGETRKEFAPGTEVTLAKVEYLNVLATIALFMNATLRRLQEKIG